MRVAIQRHARGRFERSVLLTGLRGVGKTVLLNEFGSIATHQGWVHGHAEATEDVRVAKLVAGLSRRALLEMSVVERGRQRVRRALGALRSFIKVHVPLGDVGTLTVDLEPLPGRADTGDLDADLAAMFTELGEAARDAGMGVLFTIDELQYLARVDLASLIGGLHRVSQIGLPVLVAGAGLPSLPGLAGEARSYAERLFTFVAIGSLGPADAAEALTGPVEAEGGSWHPCAIDRVVELTQGYPYFLQEFGKQAWNAASGPTITPDDVSVATTLALAELDSGFFRARIDKTTDAERDYLRAMAALAGPGPYRSGDVSRQMGKKTTQTGPVRDSLIKRGLCYAPRHNEIAFTVPMFDEFVRRSLG